VDDPPKKFATDRDDSDDEVRKLHFTLFWPSFHYCLFLTCFFIGAMESEMCVRSFHPSLLFLLFDGVRTCLSHFRYIFSGRRREFTLGGRVPETYFHGG
jgi:hypothetical protein